jgi:hypothetical protein
MPFEDEVYSVVDSVIEKAEALKSSLGAPDNIEHTMIKNLEFNIGILRSSQDNNYRISVWRTVLMISLHGIILHSVYGVKTVKEAATLIARTIIRKQRDYGKNNILAFGEFGVLVRENDKIERLKNLVQNNRTAENESVGDTWLDVGGYAVIAIMLLNGTFTLPMRE